jgi:glycosyltransferase involved in cell wall biosynthesis
VSPRASRVSIVTPSLNQGAFIEEAIVSVLEQKYPNFEHIVVDGGSTDETLAILGRYPHVKWVSEADDGQSDALNKGFRMAQGDILGWLNADDRYLPGCFRSVTRFMEARPDVDIAYGDFRWIDEDGHVIQERRELAFDPFMLKYLHMLYIPTASSFFRRIVFDTGNFLDVRYSYAMDYEFYLRLNARGFRFAHQREFLADYRWHDQSKSRSQARLQADEHRRARLAQTRSLQQMSPAVRGPILWLLQIAARAKRYLLKGLGGHYLRQWSGKTR